jgi:signal transduction histidine kinase/CheY-like chemotaxis protein
VAVPQGAGEHGYPVRGRIRTGCLMRGIPGSKLRAATLGAIYAERVAVPVDSASDEQLLNQWRERLLTALVTTALAVLVPAWALQLWQAAQGVSGAELGLWSNLAGIAALLALRFWRGRYGLRASIVIGVACTVVAASFVEEGFAPAQCVLVCLVTLVAALLFNARIAALVLLANVLCMGAAAWAFSRGLRPPHGYEHLDVGQPLNWLRIGLYTTFGSATAAVGASYLLRKLRETLDARTQLLASLRAEVAERERTASALEHTQARLLHAQKLEAIGQLAAGIAHDFNNTLSVVSLEAELLKLHSVSEPVERAADALMAAATRGKQLTQQLLMFSRVERRRNARIEATHVLTTCADTLRRLLSAELTFDVTIASGPLWLPLSEGELQQIVLNLGLNARDAVSGRAGAHVRLSLEPLQLGPERAAMLGVAPGPFCVLRCEDAGAGMSASTLQRAFEPFFSTKPAGRGTGLGLTNVWNIAQAAHGAVHIDTTPDVSTTCCVYLPLVAAGSATSMIAPAPKASGTVLVVEDDIRIRALIVTTLGEAGYSVLDAPNVDAALVLERDYAGSIDVLCTDVVMPGRPARELIAVLRTRRPNIRVVVCSGYSPDEQIARGILSGECEHLEKPFTRNALLTVIGTTLETPLDLASAPPAQRRDNLT